MKLFETLVIAGSRVHGDEGSVSVEDFEAVLPVAVLTCIDARLNGLIPELMRIPEERLIWLRNAGNIVTSPLSSTLRSIALACAVKGAKEIAVIGHTDCLICKTTVLDLTQRFQKLGVARSDLPDNLNEYFGLFASERQNVLKAVETIRQSPLIGRQMPVHGLLLDVESKRLSWVVDGYQALGLATSSRPVETTLSPVRQRSTFESIGNQDAGARSPMESQPSPSATAEIGHHTGFSESTSGTIGDHAVSSPVTDRSVSRSHEAASSAEASKPFSRDTGDLIAQWRLRLDKHRRFRILGADKRVYGPVSSEKLFTWLDEGRVEEATIIQMEGGGEWKSLKEVASEGQGVPGHSIPLPPRLKAVKRFRLDTEK